MRKIFKPGRPGMFRNKEGAGLADYGLVTGLIAVVAIATVSQLGSTVENSFTNVTSTMSEEIAVAPGAGSGAPAPSAGGGGGSEAPAPEACYSVPPGGTVTDTETYHAYDCFDITGEVASFDQSSNPQPITVTIQGDQTDPMSVPPTIILPALPGSVVNVDMNNTQNNAFEIGVQAATMVNAMAYNLADIYPSMAPDNSVVSFTHTAGGTMPPSSPYQMINAINHGPGDIMTDLTVNFTGGTIDADDMAAIAGGGGSGPSYDYTMDCYYTPELYGAGEQVPDQSYCPPITGITHYDNLSPADQTTVDGYAADWASSGGSGPYPDPTAYDYTQNCYNGDYNAQTPLENRTAAECEVTYTHYSDLAQADKDIIDAAQ